MPMMLPQRGGEDGIQDTLKVMGDLVTRACVHPLIRKQAMQAIQHCGANDRICQQAALMIWVRSKMMFIRDPHGIEALHDPVMIAEAIEHKRQPYGDCDDFSMYLAALMRSVGLRANFRVVGFNGGKLSHVYVTGPKDEKLDSTRNPWNMQAGEMLPETSVLNWRF
jgi:hypothetical protein